MFKKITLIAVFMVALSVCVRADEAPAPEVATEVSVSAEAPQAATEGSSVSMNESGRVSLDFRETDIRNVFKILSFKSGVNIVASPEVTGLVSIQLNDVPWQQALDVILQTYGYAADRKGSIILISTVENLKKRRDDAVLLAEQEPVETKTYSLNFGKASAIVESLQKMKSDRGNVNFDDRTNTIIVTDTVSRLDLIAQVIKDLDTTTPQVLIESKVVETTFSDTENLGIDWLTKATVSGAQRPISFPFTTHSNNKYAVDNDMPAAEDSDFAYGTLNFTQLQAVFELLKSRSDTNILSSPRIVTLDNQKATMTIGSQYPIPTYTYNEQQARLQISGWEYKDIGIIFDVTPRVNKAGFVTIEIQPKITAILDYVTVENTSLPRLSNESAKTNVMIKDGETLVIGGLVKNQTTDTVKKTPIIGDIPIVGYAFRKKEKSASKTDLLIFLTPHVITPEVDSESKS